MISECIESGVHIFLCPRFGPVMVRARMSWMASGIVVARVGMGRTSWWHQTKKLRRDCYQVVFVVACFRTDTRPVGHVTVNIDCVRRVHRVQCLQLDFRRTVAVLNFCNSKQSKLIFPICQTSFCMQTVFFFF